MNVLGISGLERAMAFKRKHWPNGSTSAITGFRRAMTRRPRWSASGEIVAAAAQERFDRKKQSARFPRRCDRIGALKKRGCASGTSTLIAHGFDYAPYREIYSLDPVTKDYYEQVLSPEAFLALVRRDLPRFAADRVYHVPHHHAHAASAYYTSGWDDCLVVVADAMGEAHGVGIFEGHANELRHLTSFSAQDSIGIFYSLITLHLGFDFNSDEYKIMGLAPYGDPARFRDFFAKEVQLRDDGSIRIPMLRLNKTRDERENYLATRAYLEANLISARAPAAEIADAHRDVAAALQEGLNGALLHICECARQVTGQTRLALAGGVALNCTANGQLLRHWGADNFYVQPAAGDDGTALGAALFLSAQDVYVPEARLPFAVADPANANIALGEALDAHVEDTHVPNLRMPVPLLGPDYDDNAIRKALAAFSGQITTRAFGSLEETCAAAADWIAEGRVLAWFRGAMEFGPRALGNRSILADPGRPEMRDRINAMVKKREAFRPFAPAVAQEEVSRWFDVAPNTRLPYMITIVDVREEWRAALPAITHVNGSARVQTLSAGDNPAFHQLLAHVGKRTGRRMVLNTSFNVKGQPIVNTPLEAIETFLGTGLDGLFLENHLVTRR